MHISGVKLYDWMPFAGEHVLEGLPAAPLAVVAKYLGNPRRSNWAGKTAFLEAIRWCLTGKHRKRLEDGLIHRGASSTQVVVRLTGGVEVSRIRPRGGPTKLRLLVSNQGMVVDLDTPDEETLEDDSAQERLYQLLGMDHGDMMATTAFAQGDTEALVGKTSGDRRRVVGHWLDLEFWERVGKAANVHSQKAEAARQALATAPDEPEGRAREVVEQELTQKRQLAEQLKAELHMLGEELRAWQEASAGEEWEEELSAALAEGRRLKQNMPELVPADRLEQAEEAELTAGVNLRMAQEEERKARELVSRGFDGICPVMQRICPAADTVRCSTDAAASRLQSAREDLKKKEAEHEGARVSHTQLRIKSARFQSAVISYNHAVEQVRKLRAKVEERKARMQALKMTETEATEVFHRHEALLHEVSQADTEVALLKRELAEIQQRVERKARRVAAIQDASRKARVAALAARALGPMGIAAKISAASLGKLEERGNALLAGTGLSFTLAWEREGSELASSCQGCGYSFRGQREKSCPSCSLSRPKKRMEELEILVEDGSGEVEDVRAKSGGARALVASAIRLAGGMLLRERRGSRVAWAEVDEPFGALDGENRAMLAKFFTAMLGSVGLEQAFVVSHDEALLESLPHRILILREGGTSRIYLET